MTLSHLEHFLIQAEDLAATRDWYVTVLGMRDGPHPDFGFPVHWLYIGERDVLNAEIVAWERQRNAAGARIRWKFTTRNARNKLARAYPKPANPS